MVPKSETVYLTTLGPKLWLYETAWSQKLKQFIQEKRVGTTRKRQQVYLGENEGEAISAIRNHDIHDAENLGLVPLLELTSDKESTMHQ